MINEEDLIKILSVQHLSIADIRERDPRLSEQLESTLRDAARSRLLQSVDPDLEDVKKQIQSVDLSKVPLRDLSGVLSDIVVSLDVAGEDKATKAARVESVLDTLANRLRLDEQMPLRLNPDVARLIGKAHLLKIARIGKLDAGITDVIADEIGWPGSLIDPVLTKLVTEQKLTEPQAMAMGAAASIYELADQDSDLAETIREAAGQDVEGTGWTRRLASLQAGDWLNLLRRNNFPIPSNTALEDVAQALAKRFATLHPDVALLARLPRLQVGELMQHAGGLEFLLGRNPRALDEDFSALDLSGVSSEQETSAKAAHEALRRMVRAYPGLGLAEVLSDPERSVEDKASVVIHRTSLIDKIQAHLGEGDVLHLDLSPDSADLSRLGLEGIGARPEEHKLVVDTLKSYQRMYALTSGVEESEMLLQAGYASAISIATRPLERFREANDIAKAEDYWRESRAILIDTTLTASAIIDDGLGVFNYLNVGNTQPSATDYLRKLDGYESLFSSLAFCTCGHCQSIISPAAYFVDLMHFVHEHVDPQFGRRLYHPLRLKNRRPDLWTLELTCANTDDRIATLEIVNEILENYVAMQKGFVGDFSDRTSVGEVVYRQMVLGATDSFRQPFNLPLARVHHYLANLDSSRAEVARVVGASADVVAAAELRLSQEELQLISHQELDPTALNRLYHLTFAPQGGGFAPLDAQDLVAAMAIERAQLDQLVASGFVRASGASVTIRPEKRSLDSVQNDVEMVDGLTADALDRMHRFTRLWRRVPWSIEELDRLLTAIRNTTLDTSAITVIAAARAVQDRLATTADETAALAGAIPRSPEGVSLFDRLFNPANVAPAERLPRATARFVHPSFRRATAVPPDRMLPRLLAGLGIDLDGAAALARRLAPHLTTETGTLNVDAANEDERYFVLSAANLSLLYRHALLARLLRSTVAELFQLITIAGIDAAHVANVNDVLAVVEADRWRRESGYTLDDIAVATGGTPREPNGYIDPSATAAEIVNGARDALSFGRTIFSVSIGTTEQASRELVDANPTLIEASSDGRHRLVAGADLDGATITVPPSATIDEPPTGTRPVTATDVRGVLRTYQPSIVLARALGTKFGFDASKVEALAGLAGASLRSNPVGRALRGDGPIDSLRTLVTTLRPLAVAFKAKEWDAEEINFVQAHPHRFALVPPAVTVAGLRALSVYTRLTKRTVGNQDDGRPVDTADIQSALSTFDVASAGFPTTATEALGRVLDVSPGLVAALRERVGLPAVAARALEVLDSAARLATKLGINGESLAALAASDYDTLSRGADALLSALGARNASEDERKKRLDLLAEPLREQRRDALVAWLVNSLTPRKFTAPNDLYEYFLVDADAGGCSTTSRIVAATSSVQLYIHRVIMNLEQTPPGAPDPVSLVMPESAAAEWTWRKNYRVWEANRKVFLWPENYIEPDLRDDKTPLFKEFESELLQSGISDQDVLNAYTKYLKGFEELASLTIAGVYHDVQNQNSATADVLHLVGVASTDPPVYYYRTCENLIASGRDTKRTPLWTPWHKIDVEINGRRVAPVIYRGRLHLFWANYKTRPFNTVQGGGSNFAGYRHTMSVRFTTLRPDGTWTAPQGVSLPFEWPFSPGRGIIADPLWGQTPQPRFDTRTHFEPIDDYTLSGTNWDALYLDANDKQFAPLLNIVGRNYMLNAGVDLFRRSVGAPRLVSNLPGDELGGFPVLCARHFDGKRRLYYGHPKFWYPNRNSYADLVLDERRIQRFHAEYSPAPLRDGLYLEPLAEIGDIDLFSVSGSIEDAILQLEADVLLLQGSVTNDDNYVLLRIGTTLAEEISFRLFVGGVDGLLDISTQKELREADIPVVLTGGRIEDRSNAGKLDFKGPYGVYYRELFFHIPFLIANALNGRGKFAAAQRWYHYIFDPTATEVIDVPAGTPPGERARRLLDRVWRYREFRNLDPARLRDILTDEEALVVYRKNPFNPHAIARLRLSAYQKSIVMKYVDNLLDWADFLFTQFTTETVNEALMLYIMASDILGPRPPRLGDCGEGAVQPKTYDKIKETNSSAEEILIELESWIGAKKATKRSKRVKGRYALDRKRVKRARAAAPLEGIGGDTELNTNSNDGMRPLGAVVTKRSLKAGTKIDASEEPAMFRGMSFNETQAAGWGPRLSAGAIARKGMSLEPLDDHRGHYHLSDWVGPFGWSIVRQVGPVFCVPVNRDMLAYWDRVEDRLYKIRHCQDIDGQRRELALLAPEIDPRLLVRMRAAGLTLEDVLGGVSGDLPPYRFLFLIDRAKAFAATLSSFGSALLATIEKRDGDELNRLRLVHQQNLSRLTTQMRRWDIRIAKESLAIVERQKEAAQYRREYYDGLVSQYRSGLETAESALRNIVADIHVRESLLDSMAALLAPMPQVGSPFAMKYGGVELERTQARFANATHAVADGLQAAASSVGLEASAERRAEGWKHQKLLAEYDGRQLDRQIEAARIRLDIATRALELHETGIEQLDEVLELMDGKFSNLGLYTWLSTQLRRTHRDAYQNALALARLADQAFRFERGEEASPVLAATYWDASHAGLLAGEQLLIDLQNLERRYLETNYRSLEVDQTFALSQIAPHALVQLRETGECHFTVSELFYDLFYPGHFKRRIKAVRLTIPCITGPFVNVSATLTLDRSWIRTSAVTSVQSSSPISATGASLTEVPPRRSISVATSTAQNDAGVFELSFRDERYMPFEGAGAISEWMLTLPRTFRQFDYQTINDVIMSISYTAEQDGTLRDRVESDNAEIEGTIRRVLRDNAIGRIFSLRQDFSSSFTRLLHSPTSTEVRIRIDDQHFPIFIANRPIAVSRSALLLRMADRVAPAGFQLSVNGTRVSDFARDPALGNMFARPLPDAMTANLRAEHVLRVDAAGALAPPSPPVGDASALDPERLLDVLLYIEYTVPFRTNVPG